MIPKILHRIVLPPLQPVGDVARYWQGFERLHPDWDLRTVISTDGDWETAHLFHKCPSVAGVADLIRLELLWRHGGIYVDADCEPFRSLDPLLAMSCFFGTEDGSRVSTGVIGAEPGHPAIRTYLDAILDEDRHSLDVAVNEVAGPVLAGHIVKGRNDVQVLPPECFYAMPMDAPSGEDAQGYLTRHSFVVHHWAHSWRAATQSDRQSRRLNRYKPAARQATVTLKAKWDNLSRPTERGSFGTYIGGGRVIVRLPDGSALTCFADDQSLTPELVTNGVYDRGFWNFLGQAVRPGHRVVDVGANIGLFSVRCGRLVGPLGHVDCFEPDPEVAALLGDNLTQNWLTSRSTIHQAALGGSGGAATFTRHPSMRGLSGFAAVANSGLNDVKAESFEVAVRRLDEVLPPVLPIRLVKIDVEGAEASVLDGLSGLLEEGRVDFLDLEVIRGSGGKAWFDLVAWLRRLVDEYGGRPAIVNEEGGLEPVSLDHVIAAAGHWPHVVFDLRSHA